MDGSGDRRAILDQGHAHAYDREAVEEVRGAVQRIDYPVEAAEVAGGARSTWVT